ISSRKEDIEKEDSDYIERVLWHQAMGMAEDALNINKSTQTSDLSHLLDSEPATKRWTPKRTSSATCKRGFVQFCYEPIKQIIATCMMIKRASCGLCCKNLSLMKRVMLTWVPAATALLEMMIFHLRSPYTAQRYSVKNLYVGPLYDQYANAIRNSDPEGLLTLYGRFFSFGRVFAGEVATGAKVRIMGPNYVPGGKKDLYSKSVQKNVIWMGRKQESEDVSCGNTVSLAVLDQFITKNGTLTNKNGRLTRLSKSDPMVVCTIEESCEHIIAVLPCGGIPWTVIEKSSRTVMSQSPNKHYRLYVEALPFEGGLSEAIADGCKDLAKKIWCFGPDTTGPNMVVDMCKGVRYLNQIKESVVSGFQWASKEEVVGRLFLVEIQAPENALGGIYGVLNQKCGHVFEEMQRPGTLLYNIKAYLPVVESFGLFAQLRSATSGEAFPQSVFDHWDATMADPLQPGTQATYLAADIRKRKEGFEGSDAYVYGFFKKKRLVLDDTLIQQELIANFEVSEGI
ncbi:hypothetical protein MKW98_008848, partial [Papaver atlanticum]